MDDVVLGVVWQAQRATRKASKKQRDENSNASLRRIAQ
jgi:hypothetical protein